MTKRSIKNMTLEEIRSRMLELEKLKMGDSNEIRILENELRKRIQSTKLTADDWKATIEEMYGEN